MNARLGYLTYSLNRSPSGIGRYSRELLDAVRRTGVELTVLNAGARGVRENAVDLVGAGLLPGLLTLGQFEIAWAAHRCGLELIHDPTGSLPLLLVHARRIVTIHDAIPFTLAATSTTFDWLIYHIWLPLAVRYVDAVITDSQQSKLDIIRNLPVITEKVTIISIAANRSYQPLSREDVQVTLARYGLDFPYLLYVGSIEPRKNLIRLLQAYAMLHAWSPRWHLVIVGARNFWKSSPVAEAVEKQNLKEWVHFTGYIPETDLPALYNGADLFVFPSLYEGFGLPVLEAMACGTPVVTSRTSSLPEVAGDAALLVDPHNVDEIAAAMQRVLSDPGLAGELCAKGLARAAEFSWERTARETIAVYERVLGKSIL